MSTKQVGIGFPFGEGFPYAHCPGIEKPHDHSVPVPMLPEYQVGEVFLCSNCETERRRALAAGLYPVLGTKF